jgi:hypothetical protein
MTAIVGGSLKDVARWSKWVGSHILHLSQAAWILVGCSSLRFSTRQPPPENRQTFVRDNKILSCVVPRDLVEYLSKWHKTIEHGAEISKLDLVIFFDTPSIPAAFTPPAASPQSHTSTLPQSLSRMGLFGPSYRGVKC